ncbi:response regulator [Skermanella pratensis]|uniref:response regulator n=1 Tax=Skermanella pratensis TaxID=2233999 RepID=UPI001300D7C9|nr:response regulator [Skermanella pratensis]
MSEVPGTSAYRVLLAEDDPAVRAFVSRALGHAGFAVTDVEDGQQALQALDTEPYDLLVADIVMPVVDGITLALSAAKRRPGIRILLITGYPAEHIRACNLEALIHAVIPKPFSLQEICAAARAALGLGGRG